jgi:hypothetical protein
LAVELCPFTSRISTKISAMGEERFAARQHGERAGPVDLRERGTPRAWASGRAKTPTEFYFNSVLRQF